MRWVFVGIGCLIGVWGLCSFSFVRMMQEKGMYVYDREGRSMQPKDSFNLFVDSFLQSASFQYDRIHFPLHTPLLLYIDDKEVNLLYTQERWLLIGQEYLNTKGRTDGYFTRYTEDTPDRKLLIGGYPDSETLFELLFEYVNDRWYVTDGYNNCYYSEVRTMADLEQAKQRIREENSLFIHQFP